jgi:NADH:ubiquinone oxidoreductase subunit F (NADH-binding)/(2Fe-2S) ferredoxin/NAD-dependent dihydropyrimidine dehydrogenase PreA subunit
MSGNGRATLFVCQGTGCVSSRSPEIREALEGQVKALGLDDQVEVKLTGCHGFCEQGPLVAIEPEGTLYTHVRVDDAPEIVSEHLAARRPVERLYYRDPVTEDLVPHYRDIPFYAKQTRLILRNCGHICPEEIEDYVAVGGYEALRSVLRDMTPDQVIEEVTASGLRGRGGAGFPTGKKWSFCRQAEGEPKYVICNADEGDPGAYMDRSLLEADPHSVIEGMIIGAYAIGARYGFVFVRAEYPLAVERLRTALEQAEERGFLGEDILGSGFSFSIDIDCGSGAFVCGEETALMASIEGLSGEPRQRPPFPAQSGLWGKPTNINNVKSWATVPLIISRGAEWYSSFGTETSKGTMVFSLVGKVNNSGLVEAPLGISLRSLVFDIGGGIPGDKEFKAVQTGGPSGGCIPAELADLPVDYEKLAEAGSIIGSGGTVVMDEETCMVDVAKYFLSFTLAESCGKCVPCREGLRRMREILTDITEGRGQEGDVELLEQMSTTIMDTALCGLGNTAPNPVLTTIRYFADEYRAHIEEKRCPAFVCKALTSYYIDPSKCRACRICLKECPVEGIAGGKDLIHVIDQEKCSKCGTCYDVCPTRLSAVVRLSGVPVPAPLPEDERVLARPRRGE